MKPVTCIIRTVVGVLSATLTAAIMLAPWLATSEDIDRICAVIGLN